MTDLELLSAMSLWSVQSFWSLRDITAIEAFAHDRAKHVINDVGRWNSASAIDDAGYEEIDCDHQKNQYDAL